MYEIGQKICLWQMGKMVEKKITILKEVIVTITESKAGTPLEFSQTPAKSQSLRGIGDDGLLYEKHWNIWPESPGITFDSEWTTRDDGNGENPHWDPYEAFTFYNSLNRTFTIVYSNGEKAVPKADIAHCEKHDQYFDINGECFVCWIKENS